MNQFEEAKLKAQKRMERQARYVQVLPLAPQPPTVTTSTETPKEKQDNGLTITVLIQLPDQSFELKFRKASVYQNASRSRLTKQEFKNRIKEGLKPLLGGIDEFPGGS